MGDVTFRPHTQINALDKIHKCFILLIFYLCIFEISCNFDDVMTNMGGKRHCRRRLAEVCPPFPIVSNLGWRGKDKVISK